MIACVCDSAGRVPEGQVRATHDGARAFEGAGGARAPVLDRAGHGRITDGARAAADREHQLTMARKVCCEVFVRMPSSACRRRSRVSHEQMAEQKRSMKRSMALQCLHCSCVVHGRRRMNHCRSRCRFPGWLPGGAKPLRNFSPPPLPPPPPLLSSSPPPPLLLSSSSPLLLSSPFPPPLTRL